MNRRRRGRCSRDVCEVPGCGEALRFVFVVRYDQRLGREVQRWIAINARPVRPGDEDADVAAVIVTYGNAAIELADEDRAAAMLRTGYLYVEHRRVCTDPAWRFAKRAADRA